MNSTLALLPDWALAALAAGILIALAGLLIRLLFKDRRERAAELAALGFEPVAAASETDPMFVELYIDLFGKSGEWQHRAWRPPLACHFSRQIVNGTIEVVDVGFNEPGANTWGGAVFVRSPRLSLPGFVIVSRYTIPGYDGAWEREVTMRAVPLNGEALDLSSDPELDRAYAIGSSEPKVFAGMLAGGLRDLLLTGPRLCASGRGGVLVVWPNRLWFPTERGSPQRTLRERIELGERLLELLARK